jgi:hypothetical protein
MKPDVYSEYTRIIKEYLALGTYTPMDPSHFEEKAGKGMVFTLKNYGTKSGLSSAISDPLNTSSTFHIKGPMGTGLGAENSGTYIIVTAGTGILIFLDLVAYLVRSHLRTSSDETANDGSLLNVISPESHLKSERLELQNLVSQDLQNVTEDFKLVLCVSFRSREDAIGLELLEGL